MRGAGEGSMEQHKNETGLSARELRCRLSICFLHVRSRTMVDGFKVQWVHKREKKR